MKAGHYQKKDCRPDKICILDGHLFIITKNATENLSGWTGTLLGRARYLLDFILGGCPQINDQGRYRYMTPLITYLS